ncbi:MAG: hypothetical protein E6G10_11025 [Actinobacteria bacterium]|nr:MAG: hypothetical protein E6G10_11025 [Actinomycetota bacterium]
MSASEVETRPAGFAPEPGIGLPLAIGAFGFAVLMLGLADARVFSPAAGGIFVPVAFGTGAFGLGIGGLWEFRANNTFGGTFALFYSAFLLTTGLMLKVFQPGIVDASSQAAFNDAFGAWLILWCIFTFMLSVGAYHINMPAFVAFVLLAVPYGILGIASISAPGDLSDTLTKIGGWVLIVDGATAWYLAWALAVNSFIGDRLPLWPYPYTRKAAAPPPVTSKPAAAL